MRGDGQFRGWFLEGKDLTLRETTQFQQSSPAAARKYPWWQVMCLTGVDYFSTLGYQPGIALVAVGALSPIATVVLALLTLFGALPIYRRVAEASPNGQGSIAILERLLARWKSKAFVLCLLGFAMTDFVLTITISATDAAAHVVENPYAAGWVGHEVGVTVVLLLLLGAVVLRGFRKAIGLAVVLVAVYLVLNALVIGRGLVEVFTRPEALANWRAALAVGGGGSSLALVGLALLVFPRLALGLSGFETGIAVMPLVKGDPTDTRAEPYGRIRNTKKLLTTAAILMSVLLVGSSFVTAVLVPPSAYQEGGVASGRALSYLAHGFFGDTLGTVYDLSTIAILWFAGASAMTALLNLVPRYLPRYGMAPDWVKAHRPLVVVFLAVAFAVTWVFDADVDAQAGAYATGVLLLITSAAVAVMLAAWPTRARLAYVLVALVFVYTTVRNVFERPEGIKLASFFVGAIVVTSLVSRSKRSTELRVKRVVFDDAARAFLARAAAKGPVRVVANRPHHRTLEEYDSKAREAREAHHIPAGDEVVFLEVDPGDASEFTDEILEVTGHQVGDHRVLRCEAPAIPNAIAAVLLAARDELGVLPHVYFGWTEGNPIVYVLKFIAFGEGDTAPVTREVLRKSVANPPDRPRVHVG